MINLIKSAEPAKQRIPFFLLIFFAVLMLTPSQAFAGVSDWFAGISEALSGIKSTLSGIAAFVSRISDIASFVGFRTILLLIGVIIISSGLSSTGIAKGRPAFFLALAITDAVCIIWMSSFSGFGESPLKELLPLLKSNLYIMLPFLGLWLLKRLVPLLRVWFKRLLFAVTGRSLSEKRRQIGSLSRLLLAKNVELHNAILDNLENKSSTGLSSETKKNIKEIEKLVRALKKQGKTDEASEIMQ